MSALNRRQFLAAGATAATPVFAKPAPKEKQWKGIFVIMQTPFLDNLEIDEESLRREVDFLARCGAHGIVWPAGAGETAWVKKSERLKLGEAIVREAKGRTTVLLGAHGEDKLEAMEYARYAEKAGADGVHALGPQNGTNDPKVIADYFKAIASVTQLPLSIQVSSPAMTTEFLLQLAEELPTFRIVKEEGDRVPHKVSEYAARNRRLITSTGGGAMNLMNEMARGSGGTMAGAGFADLQVRIWDLYQAGNKKKAREVFAAFLMMAVLERQTGYVLQKEILRRRGVFKTIVMRSTRPNLMDPGDLRELDEVMEACRPYFKA